MSCEQLRDFLNQQGIPYLEVNSILGFIQIKLDFQINIYIDPEKNSCIITTESQQFYDPLDSRKFGATCLLATRLLTSLQEFLKEQNEILR